MGAGSGEGVPRSPSDRYLWSATQSAASIADPNPHVGPPELSRYACTLQSALDAAELIRHHRLSCTFAEPQQAEVGEDALAAGLGRRGALLRVVRRVRALEALGTHQIEELHL